MIRKSLGSLSILNISLWCNKDYRFKETFFFFSIDFSIFVINEYVEKGYIIGKFTNIKLKPNVQHIQH